MKLLERVLILATCMIAVYASSRIIEEILEAKKICEKQYQARLNEINHHIYMNTAACISANSSNVRIAAQVDIIRNNLTILQDNISDCTRITDNLTFVQCVQAYNDVNTKLLSIVQQRAQDVEIQINNSQIIDTEISQTCMDKAIADAADNYTTAAIDFGNCLNNMLT